MATTESGFSKASDVTASANDGELPGMAASETVVPFLIGICGTFSNSMALFVLLSHENSRKKIINILVINQSLVDLLTSVMFITTYTSKSIRKSYEGSGEWICRLLDNDFIVWMLMAASTTNLVVITFERYIMVVYPVFYRKHITRSKVMFLAVFGWGLAFVMYIYFSIAYTLIDHGHCIPQGGWTNVTAARIYAAVITSLYFIIPIVVIFICYGHMVATLIKRNHIAPLTGQDATNPAATGTKMLRTQINLTKVMAIVSICFILCWTPVYIHYFLVTQNFVKGLRLGTTLYRMLQYLAFCNCCINPFIYASKYDDLKKNLKKILKKSDESTAVTVSMS